MKELLTEFLAAFGTVPAKAGIVQSETCMSRKLLNEIKGWDKPKVYDGPVIVLPHHNHRKVFVVIQNTDLNVWLVAGQKDDCVMLRRLNHPGATLQLPKAAFGKAPYALAA